MPGYEPNVCVFAPTLLVSVTIESAEDGNGARYADIHIHPGGQGFWICRMLRHLGERPVLCGPAGGEAGQVLKAITADWDIRFEPVEIAADSPCYIHDRRSGGREEVAADRPPALDRHEVDDFYGRVLELAIATGTCVVTGKHPSDAVPVELFHRLAADLARADATVIGDLHGDELSAFLDGGALRLLKVSDEDLLQDGTLRSTDEGSVLDAIDVLRARGARDVVVSRGAQPVLAWFDGGCYRAEPPELEVVDTGGSGDSMSAALAAAMMRGLAPEDTLRLACASGAANVTRRGLGSASGNLIPELAKLVRVEQLGA
jgi:1-phosphofructokinase